MLKQTMLSCALFFGLAGAVLAAPVNVNSADAKTLAKELVGVGDVIASAIVQERQAHGPYKSAEEMAKRVKGLGTKTLEKNKSNIQI